MATTYAKDRKRFLKNHSNKSEIASLKKYRHNVICDMASFLNENWKKHSPDSILAKAQNVLNNFKEFASQHHISDSIDNINTLKNEMSVLQTINSQIKTDRQDSQKVNDYVLNQYQGSMMRLGTGTPQVNDSSTRTVNYKGYNITPLVNHLKYEIDDASHIMNFKQQYGHMKAGYAKYFYGHKTYYFPIKMANPDYDEADGIVYNYIRNDDRYKRQLRLVNNGYRKLKGIEANTHWINYNNNDPVISHYGKDANKALGKYQYQTVHDEIWQQYHLARYNHDAYYRDKLNKKINKLQDKINYDAYHHPYSSKWRKLGKYRDKLERKRDNIQSQINHEDNKANWWKNIINHRNKNFGNRERKAVDHMNYLADVYNAVHDKRHGHFGYIRPRNPNSDQSFVYFMITDESPAYETQVTSVPVEWGVNMTTGTQKQQTQVQISGYLFKPNFSSLASADGKHGYFNNGNNDDPTNNDNNGNSDNKNGTWDLYYELQNESHALSNWNIRGAEMYYSGEDWYPHCMISEFTPDYNNTSDDGSISTISFSMTLTLNDYFLSNETHKAGHSKHKGRKSNKRGRNNAHWKHIRAKAGDTYGRIARNKGVKVSDLERWNKWPARQIPIGAEIRYMPNNVHGNKRVHTTHRKYRKHHKSRKKRRK